MTHEYNVTFCDVKLGKNKLFTAIVVLFSRSRVDRLALR